MSDDSGDGLTRRQTLTASAAGAAMTVLPGCQKPTGSRLGAAGAGLDRVAAATDAQVILGIEALAPVWQTLDPFLFCVHHDDAYPAGNERMGPMASLAGRELGRDFEGRDGWRMYHGDLVPGFPQHPHRGFETVTVVRAGLIDHADSLGATARYGAGDTQWLTAGAGIVHAEMFPLVQQARPNPLELFQIWMNLPAADKFVAPHFSMLWREANSVHFARDAAGRRTTVRVVAGRLGDVKPGAPPPHSWASRPSSEVAIWTVALEAGARWTLPAASPGLNRALYYFHGDTLAIGTRLLPGRSRVRVRSDLPLELTNGGKGTAELLMLQGRPIGEPVVQHGPFVMNTREEIARAYSDYQRTGFGGWPWPSNEPVHARAEGRFAAHADGRREKAG